MKKIQLEYPMNVSEATLYGRLSTPRGLSDWFAEDVNLSGDVFEFIWGDSREKAKVISKKRNESIRFRWEDEEETHFEFKIVHDDLTNQTTLLIEDFVEEPDEDGQIELWNAQVAKLMRVLGT